MFVIQINDNKNISNLKFFMVIVGTANVKELQAPTGDKMYKCQREEVVHGTTAQAVACTKCLLHQALSFRKIVSLSQKAWHLNYIFSQVLHLAIFLEYKEGKVHFISTYAFIHW